jgi:multidrug efflux system membrane fusion protein
MSYHTQQRRQQGWGKLFLLVVLSAAAAAVYVSKVNSEQTPAAQMPPPPVAEVITVKEQEVRIWTHFSGRLSAVDQAEIKPLVGGELQQVLFEDGQQVEKGDLLFVIDPRPYQAVVKRAEAQLASAKSRAKLAKDELERSERLVAKKLVSESVFDAARNEFQVATAAIDEANSALAQAKLDLDYCYIRAPFSGQLSRAELTEGNIIENSPSAPVLTTLVARDKLYAEFDVDEQTYIKSVRREQNAEPMPVAMTLAADDSVSYKGVIHSFDNRLDTSSGTIRARAIFTNTDGALTPGMYANVQLGAAKEQTVILIPERAVGTNQDKKFVYVVTAEDEAVYREVVLGAYHEGNRIVVSGLSAGDRVITNGLSHIRPNTKVTVKSADNDQHVAASE